MIGLGIMGCFGAMIKTKKVLLWFMIGIAILSVYDVIVIIYDALQKEYTGLIAPCIAILFFLWSLRILCFYDKK